MDLGGKGNNQINNEQKWEVLILVLVDLGGKDVVYGAIDTMDNRLNPCFGGFGWESHDRDRSQRPLRSVLILVLVDLGGKVNNPKKR